MNNDIKTQIFLLQNYTWCYEYGCTTWYTSENEFEQLLDIFPNAYFWASKKFTNLKGQNIDKVTGYATASYVFAKSEEDLIERERQMSHPDESWSPAKTNFFYISEVVIDKESRGVLSFYILIKDIFRYAASKDIEYIYFTAVSDDSRHIIKNPKIARFTEVLAIKEEGRAVVKFNLKKWDEINRRKQR